MDKRIVKQASFNDLFIKKEPLDRPLKVASEVDLIFQINSKDDSFKSYFGFSNDQLTRDETSYISYSKGRYNVTLPPIVGTYTIYPKYDFDKLEVTLKRHGLTLNKSGSTPYVLLGGVSEEAIVLVANTTNFDYLSSYILDGAINSVIDNQLSTFNKSLIIIPNIASEPSDTAIGVDTCPASTIDQSADIATIVNKYNQKNGLFIEINGSFTQTNSKIEMFNLNRRIKNCKELKKLFDIEVIDDQISNDKLSIKDTLLEQNSSYVNITSSYHALDPQEAYEFGYKLAKTLLR